MLIIGRKRFNSTKSKKKKATLQVEELAKFLDNPDALEEIVAQKREEILTQIFKSWVQAVGIGDVATKAESQESEMKRIAHKFVELAEIIAPEKQLNAEELMKKLENKKGKELSKKQIKSLIHSELNKL